jgi:hypothetical protein
MKSIIRIILFMLPSLSILSQSINTEFGKNRVQYHQDFKNWWQYETENFVIYWYGKGRNVAHTVIQMSEYDHDDVQRVLEHRMNDKIEIIVYTDVSDLKQSNIGTEETFMSSTGETKIVGNKMFVYFDGDHNNLRKKIKEGISNVYLNNMLFGSNIQEIIQNAVLLDIPDWYRQGIVSYAASNWDIHVENELRDKWHTAPENRNFTKFKENHPKLAGHSFWFFIEQQYGRSSISNLLYLSKISRGINNSFEYILNTDLKSLSAGWEKFYKSYFNNEDGKYLIPSKNDKIILCKKKKNHPVISKLILSPDGQYLLYALNDRGKYRVIVKNLKDQSERVIFKHGFVNIFQETDYNYPILDWHPTKAEVSVLFDRKDILYLRKYKLSGKTEYAEQELPGIFQRVYSMRYVNDMEYIFSANTDGFSDLYYYKSKNRNHERLTNDFFDDLDAVYTELGGEPGVLFSSNRTNDTIMDMRLDTVLPTGNFDIYFLPLNNPTKKLKQLTFTENENERQPIHAGGQSVYYLSDRTGIINSYFYDIIKAEGYPVTNSDRHIRLHHTGVISDEYAYTVTRDGKPGCYRLKKSESEKKSLHFTEARNMDIATVSEDVQKVPLIFKPESTKIEEGFMFQSVFPDPFSLEIIDVIPEKERLTNYRTGGAERIYSKDKRVIPFNNTRAIAANKKFSLYNITTKFDNDILFEGLESYTGDRQQLLTTPMGFLVKANVKDLFEDYIVEAGFRIPTTFNGSEYFITFDNRKKRLDKRYALYRKSNTYNTPTERNPGILQRSKKSTVIGLYQLRYPFDIYRRVQATGSLRFDRFLRLSTEQTSFQAPTENEKRASLKLEYIFDNSYEYSLNIRHGTRYKIYSEFINQFDMQLLDGFQFNLNRGFTGLVGFDARHYIPVLKRSVLALRAAGATSFGSKRMLYYLGGMENWILPRFDMSIPERQDADFAYKANVFHMRGFDNNIRNGATFLVTNAELRIPFMQYILGSKKGSSFFRNMQLTAFFDAGMAWHGRTPFSPENPLNKIQISAPPLIDMEIEYFRDPLVMGYGAGFRTRLLGYFVKLDYARGIETRRIQDGKLYISFGLDF